MMVPGAGAAVKAATMSLPAAWGGGGIANVPVLMNGSTGGSPLAAIFGAGGGEGASSITGGILSGQDPANPYVMHAVGGGQGGFGLGGFNLSNILRNFKGINWGGFTRDAGVGGPNGDFGGETDNPAGGKITGVNGLAGGALMAGGMFLAQRGLLGSSRGTWGGVAQGALGGAMVGFAVGGPIGAAIGAGIGAGIGIGEKIFGVESPENEAKRLVKQLYSIIIDNSMAQQIAGIAQQKYAGHVSIAVRDPDVRKMLMLYSQATGQKMPLSASTPQSASLAEVGGRLYQQASYVNGTPYTFQSNLPVLGGYQTGTYPMPASRCRCNSTSPARARRSSWPGQVVTPEFVQAQWSNAGASSNGRLQNSAMMQQPGLVIA